MTVRRSDVPHMPCPFVLVTGGKGGVGKSTLAANLAVELARSGRDTLLIDLDLGLANLDVLLKLPKENDVEDFLAGRRRLEDCVVEGPGGVHVLPASSGELEAARPSAERRRRILSEVSRLAAHYEIVIGDTAAGIGDDVLAFAAAADRVLVVTSPDPAAATDAYGVIKALDAFASEAGVEVATPELVVNFAGVEEARRIADKLRAVCERFLARSPRFFGWLPRSHGVLTAALRQEPFCLADPRSTATRALRRLTERLLGRARPGTGSRAKPLLKPLDCHVR